MRKMILSALFCATVALGGTTTKYVPTPQGWWTIHITDGVVTSYTDPCGQYYSGFLPLPYCFDEDDE